jgi:hypothetical protein
MASIQEKLARKYPDINDEHKEVRRRLETWLSSKDLANHSSDPSKCKHKPSICGLDTYQLYTYNASQFKDRFRWYSDVSIHIADRLSRELVRQRDRAVCRIPRVSILILTICLDTDRRSSRTVSSTTTGSSISQSSRSVHPLTAAGER